MRRDLPRVSTRWPTTWPASCCSPVSTCRAGPRRWRPGGPTPTSARSRHGCRRSHGPSPTTSWSEPWPGTRGSVSAPTRRGTTPATRPASRPGSTARTPTSRDGWRETATGLRGALRPRLHHPRCRSRRDRDPAPPPRRLDDGDEVERAETVDELTQIAQTPDAGSVGLMATVSTHVLDTSRGRPAGGVRIVLESASGDRLADVVTDADGRAPDLATKELVAGTYRLRFDTGAWFADQDVVGFYPEVVVAFEPSPATGMPTCRCSSAPTATRPTGEAERVTARLLLRARRGVVGAREVPVAVRIRDGVIVEVSAYDVEAGAAETVEPRRRRGAAPRPRRHARARQRARPHRVGGLRHGDPRRGGRRRHHDRRHAAQQHPRRPPRVAALDVKRAVATGPGHVDVGFWGGAVPGNARRAARRCSTRASSGSSASSLDSRRRRVPAARRRPSSRARAEARRRPRRAAARARRGRAGVPSAAGAPRARRTTRSCARARPQAEDRRSRSSCDAAPGTARARTSCTSPPPAPAGAAPRRGPRACASRSRPARTTCTFAPRTSPTARTAFKCCPPIRDAREPRRALGGPRRRRHRPASSPTTRPAPPTSRARDPATSTRPGAGSRRCSSGCRWCGPRRAARRAARRGRGLDGGRPGRRVGPRGKGAIAVGADADLVVFAPDETWVVDPARLHHRNPVSRRTPGVRSPAPCARPGCAGSRSTWPPTRAGGC